MKPLFTQPVRCNYELFLKYLKAKAEVDPIERIKVMKARVKMLIDSGIVREIKPGLEPSGN